MYSWLKDALSVLALTVARIVMWPTIAAFSLGFGEVIALHALHHLGVVEVHGADDVCDTDREEYRRLRLAVQALEWLGVPRANACLTPDGPAILASLDALDEKGRLRYEAIESYGQCAHARTENT